MEAVLDKALETFVVYMVTLEASMSILTIHSIRKPLLAAFKPNKALIEALIDYNDFVNIFSSDLAMEVPDHTKINKHAIKLVEGKSLLYGPIYS